MRLVAALYIDPRGPYPCMLDVECWDEHRDARLYNGPFPVVAHPPCGPWGKLRHLYKGSEHDCAPRAVEQVREWGGVLEHPAHSRLWEHCGLPLPGAPADRHGGYTVEVEQVSWGHVARKRTWLYGVRVARDLVLSTLRSGGTPTHWIAGNTGEARAHGCLIASNELRRRTPIAFAQWLVWLASNVVPYA